MTQIHRVLVLDDGETWEVITGSSNALVLHVTDAELEQLQNGERVDGVLAGRRGPRLYALLAERDADEAAKT